MVPLVIWYRKVLNGLMETQMASRKPTAFIQLKARMRESLRAKLERAAAKNKQSLNAEVVARLEASFAKEDAAGGPEILSIVQLMTGAFARGGQRGAQAKQHPEWTAAEWINDPLCYDVARYTVSYALEFAQPFQHESGSKVELQIHDTMAQQIARGEFIDPEKGTKK